MHTTERTFDRADHDDCLTDIDAERVPTHDARIERHAESRSRRPRAGDLLAGRYELDASLGTTALGELFLARMLSLRVQVAIYVVHGALGRPALRSRLSQHVRALASLRARHLGRILDFVSGEPTFVVLEYVPGRSLATLLVEQGTLEWPRAVRFTIEVASALAAMHAAGVVHGNVEPANVVVTTGLDGGGDEALLVGFGLAACEAPACEAWTWTDAAASRELALSDGEADASDDVRRLGAMLYELITGVRPARGEDVARSSRRLRKLVARRRGALPGESLRELCAIVERATSDEPARRFSSARELGSALQALLARDSDRNVVKARLPLFRFILLTLLLASVAAALAFSYSRLTAGMPFICP